MPKYLSLALCFLGLPVLSTADFTGNIRLNQVGYYPHAPKKAAIVGASTDKFHILSRNLADTLFTGTLGAEAVWAPSGEKARLADFGDFSQAGEFVVAVPGLGHSYAFRIDPSVHRDLLKGAIKVYYYNRASTDLQPKHAGQWARSSGHPDDRVIVHGSAASPGRPEGAFIYSARGWYDAGDYGKYIVNSGISVYTLLAAYQHSPNSFASLELNIPESGNGVPDLLDEVLWNLRWMLTMQDPGDGGVYHKLTTPDFSGTVMPGGDVGVRFVVQKSTAATLNFAAVMAQSSRIFRAFEAKFPGLADSTLVAAKKAWTWARANPTVYYNQDQINTIHTPAIKTGQYGDTRVADEFLWAGIELYLATGEEKFFTEGNNGSLNLAGEYGTPSWQSVASLGLYSLMAPGSGASPALRKAAQEKISATAQALASRQQTNPFAASMNATDFNWGSNSAAANQGMLMLQGFIATGDSVLLRAAVGSLDYLLGRNGTGYSYVTGFGGKSPFKPHHRPSEADGIAPPVPGFLVGGPNPGRQDQEYCPAYPSTLPAAAYLDHYCSYASNEVTINWNAPLVYLTGMLEAVYTGQGLASIRSSRPRTGDVYALKGSVRQGVLRLDLPRGWEGELSLLDVKGKEKHRGSNAGLQLELELPTDSGMLLARLVVRSENGIDQVFSGKLLNREGAGILFRRDAQKVGM